MVCYKDIKVGLHLQIRRMTIAPGLIQRPLQWTSLFDRDDHQSEGERWNLGAFVANQWLATRLFRWWFRATDIKCQNTGKCVTVGRSEHALFGLTEVVNDNLSWFIEEEIDIMRRNWGIRNEEWHCRIGFLPQGLRAGWGGVVFEPPLFRTSGGPAGNRF